ncbi:hypothetical protein [Spirosoma radiotolerans]|uniref:Uncharacterized protein n=1 Tax=Spirosoma radiotolerans TaxID=1379870 RepID=A0A0E3V7L7_9BACT|nr:hypothetical protein [Spirosoma radiotolerans]AKD55541.1 hypothetical protein SD10_12170 [Spirosoma radiotolerans]
MSESIRLVKDHPLLPAEDYVALRKLGVEHIEKLGSSLWTDYNTHDPGITMLEAVCYAITDLAYRTDWDMKDLLTPANPSTNTWDHIFYTARQILHCRPQTINDYRKLLIDIDGVRNAWLEPSKDYEVPLFLNYNAIRPNSHACGCDTTDSPCYGNLTLSGDKDDQQKEAETSKKAYLSLLDKQINQYADDRTQLEKEIDALTSQINDLPEGHPNRQILEQEKEELVRQKEEKVELQAKKIAYREKINRHNTTTYGTKILELNGLYTVLIEYEEDIQRTQTQEEVRRKVVDRLNRNRNLCEDFIAVNEVEYDDFTVQLAVDLDEQADPDQVLAQIYYTLFQYFTPAVWHHTIDQMLEKGWTIDEIFDGPALRHGFIDSNELDKTDLFRNLHVSDVINQVMDLPGVKAISRFYLMNAQGELITGPYFGQWVDRLRQERKVARLITTGCQAVFCKQRELITYQTGSSTDRRPARVNKLFADLKAQEKAYKLQKQAVDLPVPVGENMELADYYPVQYSLPACYTVKEYDEAGAIESPTRQAQTLQLRGYLLVFEQLLADYLVQLDHLRDLFSFDDRIERTYFTRVLSEITDLDRLLIEHPEPPQKGTQPGARDSQNGQSVQAIFQEILEDLVEKPNQFSERRNRFLNHLMARFSEDIDEYEAQTRLVSPQNVDHRLLNDKSKLLQDYVKISGDRARGFDYSIDERWDVYSKDGDKPRMIENISGTERRIRRLLGMPDLATRSLVPTNILTQAVLEKSKSGEKPKTNPKGSPVQVIQVQNPDSPSEVWLTSVEVAVGCCTEDLMHLLIEQAGKRSYYRLHDDVNYRARKNQGDVGQFWFELMAANGDTVIATSGYYPKREIREATIKKIMAWVSAVNAREGLHLVEHILLRPRLDEVLDESGRNDIPVALPAICLDECDLGIGLDEGEAPTHRISVSRLPADQCYDKMPWKLEVLTRAKKTTESISLLYQRVIYGPATTYMPLKFKRYEQLSDRLAALREYGSERANYQIVNNGEQGSALKYGFILHTDNPNDVLGQSGYSFNRRMPGGPKVSFDVEEAIGALIRFFSFQLDWYCASNPCDHNEDPYSFRTTVILPCWPSRFKDRTYRNLVEKTIQTQAPAHVQMRVKWVGIEQMRTFEQTYLAWLTEMATNEVPAYENVNPLVTALDTLQTCGHCQDDCGHEG